MLWLSRNGANQNLESKLPPAGKTDNGAAQSVNTFEGILWPSDNESKGNLMLTSPNATIYIKTSRDFSALTGKEVLVSINGTLDNFTLLDISENLTKDGYIKAQ